MVWNVLWAIALMVEAIMRDLRAKVRAQNGNVLPVKNGTSPQLAVAVVRARTRLVTMRQTIQRIGEPPPCPPTLRGRVGAFAVLGMRGALFWLIPSLKMVQEEVAACLEDELRLIEQLVN